MRAVGNGARSALRCCVLALSVWLGTNDSAAAQPEISEQPVRVRVAWGGAAPERWLGRVALQGGTLADPQLLGMEGDAAASVWLEPSGLKIDTPSPHLFDGVDVTVTGSADARFVASLAAGPGATPVTTEIPLADVLRQPYRLPLDDRGNELLLQRSPGDALRITTNRKSLIFRPGEQFTFDMQPLLEDLEPSTTIDIDTTLVGARSGDTVWSHEQRLPVPVGSPPIATLHVPLPREEGVYQIRIAVKRPPGFRQRFFPGGAAPPLVERAFQVVVLAESPPPPARDAEWQTVLEIDPTSPTWTERLPDWTQLRRIPGFSRRPLGSTRTIAVSHPLGTFVELPATPSGGEPHWQAYPLPLETTGVPHMLEVEYPNDLEQHLGISVVEPNAAGQAVPIGRDSGVYVEGFGHAEAVGRHTHRVVFWPRTHAPLLLVTNQHPTAAARFGQIRVLKRTSRTLANRSWPTSPRKDRLVAAYLSRPLVPESFGASEGFDPASGQSIDDWQTFYESATRLAEYLNYAGYNAAVASVMADGSALMSTARVPATPLYNTGRMVAGSNDLPPVDPLELMLRIFDRSGLALVPTLQFAAPLPELEALRRDRAASAVGIELVGVDGQSWRELHGAERGLAPHYNLLDERVQRAMLNVVRDMVDQYGHHPSFSGVGVQLSSRGYAVLPDVDWGLDAVTLARFERDTGVRLVADGPDAARSSQLLEDHGDAWRTWRTAEITRFYRKMAAAVQSPDGRRRLVLTTEELFANPAVAARVRPNVVAKSRLERMMLNMGVDRQALATSPGIAYCPTRYVESMVPLVDRTVDLQVNEAFGGPRDESQDGTVAALLFHRPQRRSLPSFDAHSPFRAHTQLVSHSSAHGAIALEAYAVALAAADVTVLLDGGELLPTGEPDEACNVRRILQSLPPGPASATRREQNLTVRTYADGNHTILLVVNECPWTSQAKLDLTVPLSAVAKPLVDGDSVEAGQSFGAGRQSWPLTLGPYDIRAVRFDTAGVEVEAIRAEISETGRRELAARVADLGKRDLNASRACSVLENPGFEPRGAQEVAGWRLLDSTGTATIGLDASTPQEGQTCLRLRNETAGTASVESHSFPTPATGQLAMTVFVRGEQLAPESEVRLVFEADRPGTPYRRYAVLGGNRPGAQPLATQWGTGYAFRSEDLPLDSRSTMRIKFELNGPGTIWIDNVQLYDLLFPLPFYEHAEPEKLQLVMRMHAVNSAYENGNLAECVTLLDGYWPRFLVAYTPLAAPAAPAPPPAVVAPAAPHPPTEAPSVGERLKQWIWWR